MDLSKWLMLAGIVLLILGFLIYLGLPLFKMPGDIAVEGEKTSFYFPIVTSIILSIALTLILNLIFWINRR
jgi:hypothetical protein